MGVTARLHVSAHAVERYIDRLRPALGVDAAKRELANLIADHGRFAPAPGWSGLEAGQPCVLIGEDIALPIARDRTLTTLVVSGTLSPGARAKRKQRQVKRSGPYSGQPYGEVRSGPKGRDRRRALREDGPSVEDFDPAV